MISSPKAANVNSNNAPAVFPTPVVTVPLQQCLSLGKQLWTGRAATVDQNSYLHWPLGLQARGHSHWSVCCSGAGAAGQEEIGATVWTAGSSGAGPCNSESIC